MALPTSYKTAAAKKIELDQIVREGVDLVDMVAKLHHDLAQAGLAKNFTAGAQASARAGVLMKEWNAVQSRSGTGPDRNAHLVALYRSCREFINPVQSALQTLINPVGATIKLPKKKQWAVNPQDLLWAIIRAKESWAYIDSHPQIVLMAHRAQSAGT
jgi:hypothetical protein